MIDSKFQRKQNILLRFSIFAKGKAFCVNHHSKFMVIEYTYSIILLYKIAQYLPQSSWPPCSRYPAKPTMENSDDYNLFTRLLDGLQSVDARSSIEFRPSIHSAAELRTDSSLTELPIRHSLGSNEECAERYAGNRPMSLSQSSFFTSLEQPSLLSLQGHPRPRFQSFNVSNMKEISPRDKQYLQQHPRGINIVAANKLQKHRQNMVSGNLFPSRDSSSSRIVPQKTAHLHPLHTPNKLTRIINSIEN